VYQLWIELRRPVKVKVGALGVIHFTEGTYIYTGRAARGLVARVLRHVRGAERLHWHIDYLLAQRCARVVKVVLASMNPDDECRVNCVTANGGTAVPGFGASDCRNGCPGHLWREDC
jgi:Uri superfamily endonuclease